MTAPALRAAPVVFLLGAGPAAAAAPMSYLEGFGARAYPVVSLTWALIALSVVVVLIITVLVVVGIARRRRDHDDGGAAVRRDGTGPALRWIYAGLALTTLTLGVFVTATMVTMAAIRAPATTPAVTVSITGHQWWWEARYSAAEVSRTFTTANELHIPVGEPVRIVLNSADVIHSFWVPALGGKMDLIPGQTNAMWIEADHRGVYRGICNEYCGLQHAHMAFRVFADAPEDFAAWWDRQLNDAPEPQTEALARGEALFVRECGACHAVRGTVANGAFGPDLSHLMDRTTLASGTLPNTVGHLSAWIADPQHLKPGTTMPNPDISGPELALIRNFLLTLE